MSVLRETIAVLGVLLRALPIPIAPDLQAPPTHFRPIQQPCGNEAFQEAPLDKREGLGLVPCNSRDAGITQHVDDDHRYLGGPILVDHTHGCFQPIGWRVENEPNDIRRSARDFCVGEAILLNLRRALGQPDDL